MLNSIFGKAIWDRKTSLFATSLGMFVIALLFAVLHKSFAGEVTRFAKMVPSEFSAFLGDISAAATPEGFLAVELYSLFLPFLVAITGITFASKAIGREEDSGTLELLLASPISRSKIIWQKLAAIKTTLFIVAFSAFVGVVLGKALFVFDVNLTNVALASLSVCLLGMVYAMASLAGQGLTGKTRRGVGIGAGLLVLTYVANVVSKLVDNLESLKYLSPFYYMDISEVLNGNGDLVNFAVLLGTTAVFYVIAHIGLVNRDTGV
jgi:ABC-2 type transport system permease protein